MIAVLVAQNWGDSSETETTARKVAREKIPFSSVVLSTRVSGRFHTSCLGCSFYGFLLAPSSTFLYYSLLYNKTPWRQCLFHSSSPIHDVIQYSRYFQMVLSCSILHDVSKQSPCFVSLGCHLSAWEQWQFLSYSRAGVNGAL
mmetsp:Transcript_31732/g.57450  ORF Transcript_31732/g.57450 Transcript_31732/m.57450 type:complete len:143 (-) Transcript_31732:204-632(-)